MYPAWTFWEGGPALGRYLTYIIDLIFIQKKWKVLTRLTIELEFLRRILKKYTYLCVWYCFCEKSSLGYYCSWRRMECFHNCNVNSSSGIYPTGLGRWDKYRTVLAEAATEFPWDNKTKKVPTLSMQLVFFCKARNLSLSHTWRQLFANIRRRL